MKLRWRRVRHRQGEPAVPDELPIQLVSSRDRSVHLCTRDDLAAGVPAGMFKVFCGRVIFSHSQLEPGRRLCILCKYAIEKAAKQRSVSSLIPTQRTRRTAR